MEPPRDWMPESGLGPDPATVREVLAIRPGGLAAVVHAVPALRHVRAAYPHARITVAADAPARELLDACPYVDRSIDLARPSEARVERFDIAVSFAAPNERGPLLVDDVDATFRAQWASDGSGERGAIHPEWPARLAEGSRMLRLAWLLGGESGEDSSLGLWPTLADRNGAARLVARTARPIALVHVGAGRSERAWQPHRWARVVDALDAAGLAPVLVGSDSDVDAADATVIEATVAPLVLVGRTSVGELAGLLERSALFIGGDSGPAALAGAIGVRSILIGPASSLEHVARPGQLELIAAGVCAACGEVTCIHPPAPASAVPLESVLASVTVAAASARQRWEAARIA